LVQIDDINIFSKFNEFKESIDFFWSHHDIAI